MTIPQPDVEGLCRIMRLMHKVWARKGYVSWSPRRNRNVFEAVPVFSWVLLNWLGGVVEYRSLGLLLPSVRCGKAEAVWVDVSVVHWSFTVAFVAHIQQRCCSHQVYFGCICCIECRCHVWCTGHCCRYASLAKLFFKGDKATFHSQVIAGMALLVWSRT